ncbi:MAG: RNase P modulator RnpM [Christensenellales bacterium]|nr:YlxR family protein [Clostridiales bacterium]MDD7414226.1 YlxR family protein [Clostridiales bacterium]MDY5732351.1 YlxR family protein [Eubacteriales bacterium]
MPKKIPMRMCVGCREMHEKRELIRIVKSAEGMVSIDMRGKAPGRGAYICRKSDCLERAMKSRALERALEHRIEPDVYERLREELAANEQQ